MFLDMLTADAASKHGHEFSEPQQLNRWLGARRSPFKVLPYTARPRLPTRSRSVRGIVGELGELPEEADLTVGASRYHDMSVDDLHIPGSYRNDSPPVSPPRARSTTPRLFTDLKPDHIKEQSPEQAQSVTGSSILDNKSRRPKTQFSVAVPPPCALPLRKQGIARPRAFFQLQTKVDSRFHRPIYELVPLSRIDGTRKVGQLIRRLGKVKENITNDDLAVVRVESYNSNTTRRESVDMSETRDVLGIISPMPRSNGSQSTQAQIFLDGAVWDATTGSNGRYNLQCIGADRHAARWYVPRIQKKRTQSPGGSPVADRKLYFAAILPHTTKHPTLASLSKTNLDIYDWYTLNTEASSVDALTPLETTTPLSPEGSATAWPAQHTETSSTTVFNLPIDDLHRKLIVVSSFWVMLSEGWSSQYSFPTIASSNSSSIPATLPSGDRSMSLPVTREDKLSVTSTTAPTSSLSTRQTTPERLSMSAASPAPSVHTDVSFAKSNRLSLGSFTFKRLQNGSSAKQDEDVPPGQKVISAPPNKVKLDGVIAYNATVPNQTISPDAGERQEPNDTVTAPSKANRPSAFRFGSMVRKMSNSVSAREGHERRSRSISWKWQPSSRGDANSSQKQNPEPTAVEKTQMIDALPPADTKSGIPTTTFGHDNEDDVVSLVESAGIAADPETTFDKSTHAKSEPAPVDTPFISVSSDAEQTSDTAQETESDVGKSVSPAHSDQADIPTSTRTRQSVSSDGSQEIDVGTPYWKDFDRLQMHNFWRRASSSDRPATAYEIDSVLGNSRAASRPTSALDEDVVQSIERPEDHVHSQRPVSMIDSIRQWSRRRKPSLSPGDLPDIASR